MTMIALLNDNKYFTCCCKGVNDFLVAYATHIGSVDKKVFEILVNSGKMSTEELIEYINNEAYSWEDEIVEIYELGEKIC